uniref:Uncharacterized protein MANES_10G043700 n=1 Tax=Rhizophora mucronata TaxID=61149 RepID=A0A2P2KEF8_RHIMU
MPGFHYDRMTTNPKKVDKRNCLIFSNYTKHKIKVRKSSTYQSLLSYCTFYIFRNFHLI